MSERLSEGHVCHTLNHLSVLQKWILVAAFKKLSGEGIDATVGLHLDRPPILDRLYSAEIKSGFYNLKPQINLEHWKNLSTYLATSGCGGQLFDATIAPKYNAICVAISRAITRLENRKFVTVLQGARSHWTAVQLTDSGKQAARWIQETP